MKLNTKYEITVDPNEISACGILGIYEFVEDEGLPLLPLSFSMKEWILQTGEFRGKLPNRLGALLKKEWGIKLTSEQRTAIGNIARMYTLPNTEYTFDFVDSFNWEDGDFGDSGSCFWGDNYLARNVLEEEGALAIRFYDESLADYNGVCPGSGRAWIYQLDRETWVLFNAYGVETRPAARVLTTYLTQSTDKQWECKDLGDLMVSGQRAGLVYLNDNPQVIFVSGSGPPDEVDLDWARYVECDSCEMWTLEEDLYDVSDERLCYSCSEQYTECYRCGEMFFLGGMYLLEEKIYCPDCYVEREEEIEEELRMERLEMRRHATEIAQEAERLISSLTYDEQIAAGQMQFEFMYVGHSDVGQYTECSPYHPRIRSLGAKAPA